MRIMHVITTLDRGGAEAALVRLCLADKDNSHYVVSLKGRGVYGDLLEASGVYVFSANLLHKKTLITSVVALFREIKRISPDIVQTWMYHADLVGGLLARFASCRAIFWGIRGPYDRRRTPVSTRIVVKLCAILSYWLPMGIVSNSKFAIESHRNQGYDGKKLVHIPNGYESPEAPIELGSIRRVKELPIRKIVIGMVARYDPYKDHMTLFKALKVLSHRRDDFICHLVGPGMTHENGGLQEMICASGVAREVIRLMGPTSSVGEVFAGLDVHVLSSAAESAPNVVAEAMSYGVPCVSTDVGDAGLIIGDTGWTAPPEDPIALADAIEGAFTAMQDQELWRARQEACVKRIRENYSMAGMVNAYHSLWRKEIAFNEQAEGYPR
ncbi:glycosyltransferase [Hahella sp. KA22]|uniref:glycosyltransferase n=1 Tax=Hahella sp. KA22 TaxID=1628392 RepID=UPI000FDF1D20|nr:glycosyltransferase [Hahella sp. KA22]AZZ91681.1 glycosyltransferase [Hahella sp. KA22]QAY55051.1 glycosyltransferase [Hahella sp. KA22]